MELREIDRRGATGASSAPSPSTALQGAESANVAVVKEYFRRVDASEDASTLFSQDFEFYYPKFGRGAGPQSFVEFATGLLGAVRTIRHPVETMTFVEQGSKVVVEGEFSGEMHSGEQWEASKTPTGRFCSSFTIEGGLVSRMYIYVDPDYASRNKDGFLWGTDRDW